jgi:hypothetical protein
MEKEEGKRGRETKQNKTKPNLVHIAFCQILDEI